MQQHKSHTLSEPKAHVDCMPHVALAYVAHVEHNNFPPTPFVFYVVFSPIIFTCLPGGGQAAVQYCEIYREQIAENKSIIQTLGMLFFILHHTNASCIYFFGISKSDFLFIGSFFFLL